MLFVDVRCVARTSTAVKSRVRRANCRVITTAPITDVPICVVMRVYRVLSRVSGNALTNAARKSVQSRVIALRVMSPARSNYRAVTPASEYAVRRVQTRVVCALRTRKFLVNRCSV